MLSPDELSPPLTGDLELVDAESGESVEVSLGGPVMRRYHARLSALQEQLRLFALRGGGAYHLCDTSAPLREFFLGTLRTARLVR